MAINLHNCGPDNVNPTSPSTSNRTNPHILLHNEMSVPPKMSNTRTISIRHGISSSLHCFRACGVHTFQELRVIQSLCYYPEACKSTSFERFALIGVAPRVPFMPRSLERRGNTFTNAERGISAPTRCYTEVGQHTARRTCR